MVVVVVVGMARICKHVLPVVGELGFGCVAQVYPILSYP